MRQPGKPVGTVHSAVYLHLSGRAFLRMQRCQNISLWDVMEKCVTFVCDGEQGSSDLGTQPWRRNWRLPVKGRASSVQGEQFPVTKLGFFYFIFIFFNCIILAYLMLNDETHNSTVEVLTSKWRVRRGVLHHCPKTDALRPL